MAAVKQSLKCDKQSLEAREEKFIGDAILKIAEDLKIRRMPTYSEILKHEGKSTLNVKIAAAGGIKEWAKKLALPLSDPDEIGICEICGSAFNRKRPQERYCSLECRKEAFRRTSHTELVCPVCGKKFVKTSKNQKYCCSEHAEQCREARKAEKRRAGGERKARPRRAGEVCRRKESCRYGAQLSGFWYCDYLSMTGHPRGQKGCECKHYEKRTEEYRPKRYDLW